MTVSGGGVVGSVVNVTSRTSLTGTFNIDANADLGAHMVGATTAGGASESQTFTVKPPPPTITAMAPASGVAGTTVIVTLSGTNFVPNGMTVAVDGVGVTPTNVTVTGSTSLTVTFAISSAAGLGTHSVTVTTAGGTSAGQSFTVLPVGPTLTSVSPATGVRVRARA